jgi:SAM-dependent methyltransferase
LFVNNNDKIDFAALERRISSEIARLSRSTDSSPGRVSKNETASLPNVGIQVTAATGEIEMTAEPAIRRSLWRTLSHFLWGILHPTTVLRRIISGYYAAEYARARVTQLGQVTDLIQARVSATEQLVSATEQLEQVIQARVSAIEKSSAELRMQITPFIDQLAMIRREVMFQQRQLTRLAAPATGQPLAAAAAAVSAQRLDSLYAAFEDVFRGSREDIIQRLSPYAERLAVAGAGQPDKPIVDIGCGRGEWLELLRNKGLAAYGIDINTIMVERSVALGLDARRADLIAHLRDLEDASRSAVTAFHVVEHLPFETLIDFFDEALRVLIPGGILILETPNPETMRVGATTFYNDPTHRNPLMPAPLQFIVEHRGFTDAEILKLHPFTQGLLQEPTEDAQLLNHVLFGPQDYAIIARRP